MSVTVLYTDFVRLLSSLPSCKEPPNSIFHFCYELIPTAHIKMMV